MTTILLNKFQLKKFMMRKELQKEILGRSDSRKI
jgi:hypothetical protein